MDVLSNLIVMSILQYIHASNHHIQILDNIICQLYSINLGIGTGERKTFQNLKIIRNYPAKEDKGIVISRRKGKDPGQQRITNSWTWDKAENVVTRLVEDIKLLL